MEVRRDTRARARLADKIHKNERDTKGEDDEERGYEAKKNVYKARENDV